MPIKTFIFKSECILLLPNGHRESLSLKFNSNLLLTLKERKKHGYSKALTVEVNRAVHFKDLKAELQSLYLLLKHLHGLFSGVERNRESLLITNCLNG